ncbi:HlyD family type I secretion periplasmic adaptor subunit [Chromobacterium sp. ATCC 53434]|uniref:HlyD family type I secretion periplasmic adaptor subunit n=1 Tax=Chromobacterium sp. (strain ATCC 53434 / SC 14030) TaxID=2059672 RepID=UPI000C78F5E4|nr:HlyD family type I secretion periplasmic adaptor subunit [Chromobacterium sp. ATCC 53434]AUH50737.1 HlyD family type I secretion periplasmic adaptor subunit [Chromobacterium sp. ATCC 53434]
MKSLRFQALGDLVRRYAAVWRAGWAVRAQLDAPEKLEYELAFQAAHLELLETPIHPAPRWTARMIVALAAIALAVALFAQLDIVATAKGKLVPDARVKVIQPAMSGVVRAIAVRDGQRVSAGALLMKLDTAQAEADSDKAKSARLDAALAAARAQALINAQRANGQPRVALVDGAPQGRQQEAQRLAEGAYREFQDKLAAARAELAKREAELGSTRQEIAKLTAIAPLARAQANAFKSLAAGKYVAQNDYLDKEQAALDKEHELGAQRSHARELAAGIAEQRAEIGAAASQFDRQQLDELERASEQLAQSRNDEAKAKTRESLLSLTAPVAGTVQQLSVHTLGGVVTTAQSLMEIVPDDALEVEATVENKDVGFVKVGQRAAVKLEAFPFSRYGMLEGEVVSLANDAVQDRKMGLAFVATIRLKTNRMRIDRQWIALTPGMAVSAEIKTGRQSVAQYILGPLIEGAQESMRER